MNCWTLERLTAEQERTSATLVDGIARRSNPTCALSRSSWVVELRLSTTSELFSLMAVLESLARTTVMRRAATARCSAGRHYFVGCAGCGNVTTLPQLHYQAYQSARRCERTPCKAMGVTRKRHRERVRRQERVPAD